MRWFCSFFLIISLFVPGAPAQDFNRTPLLFPPPNNMPALGLLERELAPWNSEIPQRLERSSLTAPEPRSIVQERRREDPPARERTRVTDDETGDRAVRARGPERGAEAGLDSIQQGLSAIQSDVRRGGRAISARLDALGQLQDGINELHEIMARIEASLDDQRQRARETIEDRRRELEAQERGFAEQARDLENQRRTLQEEASNRERELQNNAREIEEQQRALGQQREEIERQQQEVRDHMRELNDQQRMVDQRMNELDRREDELRRRQEEVNSRMRDDRGPDHQMTPGKPGPSTEHAPQPDKHGGGGNPLAGIIAIVLFVIWIWALQDCLRRGPGGFPSGSKYDKPVWIFVIVFTLFIGALLYLFCLFGQPREGKTA